MNDDPYKNIPSLDVEIGEYVEEKPKRASIVLFIISILFIAVSFVLNILFRSPSPPENLSVHGKIGYMEGHLYAPVVLPFVIVLFLQLFKVFRNNRARVKALFWVSLFFVVGALGAVLNHA